MDAARRISALTHGDPAAGEGCAILHELVRVALDGGDPLAALPDALAAVAPEHRGKWESVLAAAWQPSDATESNGAVWPTLGSAVWALRKAGSFAEGMRLVLDLGGDTDTVAAVTGGLLGAVYGIAGIPMRWTSVLNGVVPGYADRDWDLAGLQQLAERLGGDAEAPSYALDPDRRGIEPVEVFDGIWASDVYGARDSDRDFDVPYRGSIRPRRTTVRVPDRQRHQLRTRRRTGRHPRRHRGVAGGREAGARALLRRPVPYRLAAPCLADAYGRRER
jgi:ADP-ribosyl-[dinitrogen reductase] hydrolase